MLVISSTDAARILGILPFALPSHNAIFQKLMDSLHSRGHHVTVISSFPPKSESANYSHISIANKIPKFADVVGITDASIQPHRTSYWNLYRYFNTTYSIMDFPACDGILSLPEVQKLYKSETKLFDLLIVEMYQAHCYIPMATKHNVPVVWLLTLGRSFDTNLVTGNVQNPSFVPILIRKYQFTVSRPADFYSRLTNTLHYLMYWGYYTFVFQPMNAKICHKYFDHQYCEVDTLKRVSLVLTYGHSGFIPRPLVPNIVEIGGLHVKAESRLPADLQRFLDESTEGVVYASFGTIISIAASETKYQNALLEAFSKCPLKILWRCDLNENDTRLSSNIHIRKWLPQRDILAHKNVKVFVMHGGLLSTYEAIYTATPVVGISFFLDQFENMHRITELEAGISINFEELTENSLTEALNKVINEKKYRENMQYLSNVFRDRPISPLDAAMYWTEYVLKHNGAPHMRSVAADMPLYQYLLLDVMATLIFIVVVVLYLCCWLFRRLKKQHKTKIE